MLAFAENAELVCLVFGGELFTCGSTEHEVLHGFDVGNLLGGLYGCKFILLFSSPFSNWSIWASCPQTRGQWQW